MIRCYDFRVSRTKVAAALRNPLHQSFTSILYINPLQVFSSEFIGRFSFETAAKLGNNFTVLGNTFLKPPASSSKILLWQIQFTSEIHFEELISFFWIFLEIHFGLEIYIRPGARNVARPLAHISWSQIPRLRPRPWGLKKQNLRVTSLFVNTFGMFELNQNCLHVWLRLKGSYI